MSKTFDKIKNVSRCDAWRYSVSV